MLEASQYQLAIFHEIKNGNNNLIVEAKPGSGKTTTIVEACTKVPKESTKLFLAFNKHIAEEISAKLKGLVEVRTSHSLGRSLLSQVGIKINLDSRKYNKIVKDVVLSISEYGVNIYETTQALTKLVNIARLTLADTDEAVEKLLYEFDLQPQLKKYVFQIIEEGLLDFKKNGRIDFADMVYLPSQLNFKPNFYDYVFVDEAQDLNNSQIGLLSYVVGPQTKLVAVGDRRQSIYNFMGANSKSLDIIAKKFNCKQMPLSICYRCPKQQVKMASAIESTIEVKENAIDGEVELIHESKIKSLVIPGDLILCRTTAPLVSLCISLIADKKNARVRGRDVGKQLTSIIKKVSELYGYTWQEFNKYLQFYTGEQIQKLSQNEGNEERIEQALDKTAAIEACYMSMQCSDLNSFIKEVEDLFSDNQPAIILSTIHRAKGLEANHVIALNPNRIGWIHPKSSTEESKQEINLAYILITRSMQKLTIALNDKPISGAMKACLEKIGK